MELKEFVKETLTQIVAGVCEAQEAFPEGKAYINPRGIRMMAGDHQYAYTTKGGNDVPIPTKVEFDIGLASENKAGAQTKSGVFLPIVDIGVGMKGDMANQNSSITKVKFSVPLLLPITELPEKLQPK